MPRASTIRTHADRRVIERELLAETPLRNMAERFGVSVTALHRHKHALPRDLVVAHDAQEAARADDLLIGVQELRARAMALLTQAEAAGDHRTALHGVREARACLELLAKLLGELDERSQVNILIAPEWGVIRNVLLSALGPYPEARAAVVLGLESLGGTE